MTSVAALADRVRLELGDLANTFEITLTGNGTKKRFETGMFPVDGSTVAVTVAGVNQPSVHVAIEERTGVLIFLYAPAANAAIVVKGTRYRYFGSTDITRFVNDAVAEHVYHRTDSFGRQMTISNLPLVEEYPVSVLATMFALMALATDASFDIDIMAPDGVSIPRSERYRQIMDMLATRQQQYKELCAALNIGLNRIEVFHLRRVSRTTNKLVPVYLAQEIDDYSKAKRAYLPTNTLGTEALPAVSGIYDLAFTQGDSFEATLDFPFNLTGYTAKAQVRLFPESQQAWAEFTITTVSLALGQIKISLTPAQTVRFPPHSFWDIQLSSVADPNFIQTYLRGSVFAQRQITREGGLTQDNLPGINPPLLSGDAQEGFQVLTVFDGTGQGTA